LGLVRALVSAFAGLEASPFQAGTAVTTLLIGSLDISKKVTDCCTTRASSYAVF